MSERQPTHVAQPGMTAWGRAAERELEDYAFLTSVGSPVDLADRVMAALHDGTPARRHPWDAWLATLVPGRLRLAGGIVVVGLAMTVSAALVAGASGFIRLDSGPPAWAPDDRPIVIAPTTPSPNEAVDEVTPAPTDATEAAETPVPVRETAPEPVSAAGPNDEPEATDPDETDEPEATNDRDGGTDADEPDGPDEPGDDGSSGGSGGDDGDSSGHGSGGGANEPEHTDGS